MMDAASLGRAPPTCPVPPRAAFSACPVQSSVIHDPPFCMVGHRSFLILSPRAWPCPVSARFHANTVLKVMGARISWLAATCKKPAGARSQLKVCKTGGNGRTELRGGTGRPWGSCVGHYPTLLRKLVVFLTGISQSSRLYQ